MNTSSSFFLNCLRSQGRDDNILLHFARNSVYHLPYQNFRGRPRASQTSASWWLVLPFHPVWEHPAISSFCSATLVIISIPLCCAVLLDVRSASDCGHHSNCRTLLQFLIQLTKNHEGGWTGFVVAFPFFLIRQVLFGICFTVVLACMGVLVTSYARRRH